MRPQGHRAQLVRGGAETFDVIVVDVFVNSMKAERRDQAVETHRFEDDFIRQHTNCAVNLAHSKSVEEDIAAEIVGLGKVKP